MKIIYVNKESCLHKELFTFLLKNIEASPDATFYESELTHYSKSAFEILRKQKYLRWVAYDPEKEPYYSSRLGDSGNERFIRRSNGKIYAYSTEDSGLVRLELKEEDINRWVFDVQTLIQSIKKANSLSCQVNKMDDRIYFMGEFDSGARQFGVYLGLFGDEDQAKSLIGLRQRIKQYEYVLVLCPTFEIADQGLVSLLEKQKVFCSPFHTIFKEESFQIDFNRIKSPEKIEKAVAVPELNATEKRKYAKDYPRKDVIQFIDKEMGARSYAVLINGRELQLQYSILGLLLYLALAVKQERDTGWVSYDSVEKEKLVRSRPHFHRSMSELSGKINPFVEPNEVKIIQNIKRRSMYRLTTMPSRIKAPHSRWMSSKYKIIKEEIIKERASRIGKENV